MRETKHFGYGVTTTTCPALSAGSSLSTFAISGRVWMRRMLAALSTTTAMVIWDRLFWKDKLRSPVMNTWNSACANSNKRPFFMPFQPISWTVLTSWPGNSRRSRQSRHSSSSTFTSGGGQQFLGCCFDKSDDLLALYRRKTGQKLVYCFSALQVVDQVLHRHARASENRGAPHNLGIRSKHVSQVRSAHVEKRSFRGKREQALTSRARAYNRGNSDL